MLSPEVLLPASLVEGNCRRRTEVDSTQWHTPPDKPRTSARPHSLGTRSAVRGAARPLQWRLPVLLTQLPPSPPLQPLMFSEVTMSNGAYPDEVSWSLACDTLADPIIGVADHASTHAIQPGRCTLTAAEVAVADSFVNCPIGQARELGTAACAPCATGQAQLNGSATSCVTCDAGRYSPVNGSILCFPCSIGSHSPANGATTCDACSPGKFSEEPGKSSCSFCPTGGFYASEGATARSITFEACPSGSYNPSTAPHRMSMDMVPLTLDCTCASPVSFPTLHNGQESLSDNVTAVIFPMHQPFAAPLASFADGDGRCALAPVPHFPHHLATYTLSGARPHIIHLNISNAFHHPAGVLLATQYALSPMPDPATPSTSPTRRVIAKQSSCTGWRSTTLTLCICLAGSRVLLLAPVHARFSGCRCFWPSTPLTTTLPPLPSTVTLKPSAFARAQFPPCSARGQGACVLCLEACVLCLYPATSRVHPLARACWT